MSREVAERVRDRALELVDDRIRLVGVYDEDSYERIYVREDLREVFDQGYIDSILFPLLQAHRQGMLIHGMFSSTGPHQAVTREFGNVLAIQFPTNDSGGVHLTLDSDGEPFPAELYEACKAEIWESG